AERPTPAPRVRSRGYRPAAPTRPGRPSLRGEKIADACALRAPAPRRPQTTSNSLEILFPSPHPNRQRRFLIQTCRRSRAQFPSAFIFAALGSPDGVRAFGLANLSTWALRPASI